MILLLIKYKSVYFFYLLHEEPCKVDVAIIIIIIIIIIIYYITPGISASQEGEVPLESKFSG